MAWYTICTIIAATIYFVYNVIALAKFGVPKSLSNTYYLYKEQAEWKRFLFPVMMVSMAFLLMPAWLDISEGSNWQFTAFLAAAGIMFVGAAPGFKDNDLTRKVHESSAILAATAAIAWVCLVAQMWYVVVAWAVLVVAAALLTKTFKKALIYWLETIAFMATFTSILIYEIILEIVI